MKRTLATASWFLLGYTVAVILWGAFVRATGAGAGCGAHWPLCNGEVIPHAPSVETLIELTHRLTSGLLGIFVLAFVVGVFRAYPRGHAVRHGAGWSLFFIVSESLLGAGLVTFEWVAANDSEERVYMMAFHLVNTFLLLAALSLTAWFASGGRALRLRGRPTLPLLALALVGVLAVGASGAVTALGDTLLLREGIQPEDSFVVARLVASRFYHPTLATMVAVLVAFVALRLAPGAGDKARKYGRALAALYLAQLALGAINVYLRAPVAIQLAHLLLSDVIWIVLVLLAATVLQEDDGRLIAAG